MKIRGVETVALWDDDHEVPEGYFVFRVLTAIGQDLDTKGEYGVQISFTERPDEKWLKEASGWARASLEEYEHQHDIKSFRRTYEYGEHLTSVPPDEEMVAHGHR